MSLRYLNINFFRNYDHAEIELPERGALFVGANGAGKTNLLEAIHYLYTGRSQRGASKRDVIQRGRPVSSLFGKLRSFEGSQENEISYKLYRSSPTVVELNGKRLSSLSEWFGQGMVVSFGPEDIALVTGGPVERRRYMDVLLSQRDASYLSALISYRRSLAQRNSLLQAGRSGDELSVYEERMAQDGALIFQFRSESFERISSIFKKFYAEISATNDRAEIEYKPSISFRGSAPRCWKNVFYNTLKEQRKRDFSLGFSSVGPHRDDLRCMVGGLPAKTHASQGQSRSVALALRLSAMESLRNAKGRKLTLLVDDAFAGLDAARRERVYPLVKTQGQLFVTSHSVDIPQLGDISRFSVEHGILSPL
ncbi:MAG: DNA replication and repair protein RecF [Chitinivibrionales bacterium]|nr:DNA replication and repair protein RecF [Chitinivibrionales bacterium]